MLRKLRHIVMAAADMARHVKTRIPTLPDVWVPVCCGACECEFRQSLRYALDEADEGAATVGVDCPMCGAKMALHLSATAEPVTNQWVVIDGGKGEAE